MDVKVKDNGTRSPMGILSVQTEETVARQKDKPYNVGEFNDGVKGDSDELEGMPTPEEFTESDFNVALRFPSAIRTMWSDDVAIEVMEALLLHKPFELLNQKLQRKGEQDAR